MSAIVFPEDYAGNSIQLAIDDLVNNRGGGVVFLREPSYQLAAGLLIDTPKPVIIRGSGWSTTRLYGHFPGHLITFRSGERCGVENIRLDGVTQEANHHGLSLKRCPSPMIANCVIQNFDNGITVGEGSDVGNPTQKARMMSIDFGNCRHCIYLVNQVETTIENIHADLPWDPPNDAVQFAVITAIPVAQDYFDSVTIRNVTGFRPRQYGIKIEIKTGSPFVNGRNHIGDFSNIIFEVTTVAGIDIDGEKTGGRLSLTQYYGDTVSVSNCYDFKAFGNQIHGDFRLSNCPGPRVYGNQVNGNFQLHNCPDSKISVNNKEPTISPLAPLSASITDVDIVGHKPNGEIHLVTTAGDGWLILDDSPKGLRIWGCATALWAARRAGATINATLHYTSREDIGGGTFYFRGVERIHLVV